VYNKLLFIKYRGEVMKKILLVVLIVGALSACSNSKEEEMGIVRQIHTLNENISIQNQEYKLLKAKTEELKIQVESLNNLMK
jgi:cell division protein FtsB